MFKFLFAESMYPFYQNIASFPTVFFTFFLILVVLFWLIAVLGFFDIDFLDIDTPDVDTDIQHVDVLAGLLLRFGLNGVPVTIVVSFISLFGWLICYYAVHFLSNPIDLVWVRLAVDIVILVVSLYLSTLLTSWLIKPMRKFFSHATTESSKHILGQILVVRTSRVDDNFGEARLEDGGAGLILKVRSGEAVFKMGDRVVPIEYLKEHNVYRVIAEDEFLGNT